MIFQGAPMALMGMVLSTLGAPPARAVAMAASANSGATATLAGTVGGPEAGGDRGEASEAAALPAASFLKDPGALAAWLRDRNREVMAAAARVQQAEAELRQSRLHPNPSLGSSLSDVTVGRTNPPGLGYGDTAIYGAALSETIELGKRGPRIRSAEFRLQSERQSYLDTLSQKVAEARSVLGRIAYLRARQGVLEESLAGARQILDLQHARLENGDLSGSDYDRLLVDTMVLDSEVSRTRSELAESLSTCRAVLYAPCAPPSIEIAALPTSAEVPEAPDLEAALESRPDLRAIDLDRASAQQDAVLARRRRIPDPNLSVGYTHDDLTISGDQPNTLLFSVALPLPVFDRGQHDARKAEEHALELQETATGGRARARSEIEALLERKGFLESTLGLLQDQALPKSKAVLDAAVSAVSQGEVGMTELLLARRTHIDLLLKVMDLQFDAFSVRNDLRRALGLDAKVAGALLER